MIKPKYIWNMKQSNEQEIEKLVKEHGVSAIAARLLVNRGITDSSEVKMFMNPSLESFHDPFLMKGMEQAVERILEAQIRGEQLFIYGDYDVDGITSTSVLYMFLKEHGFKVSYYIPDRLEEGYGINTGALDKIKDMGGELVISVDTGITAVDQAEHARTIGLDMIITDHHEPQEVIPNAIAVIDPKQEDCNYPFQELAGVGVTFKLITALAMKLNQIDTIYKYLDIVAVGTVADIVPLVNENRIIVKHAFDTIPRTWNIGLRELLDVAGFDPESDMSAGIIGFRVGPRLNAAGRLGDAKRGVELFITQDAERAKELAKELDEENNARQQMEKDIFEEAVTLIEANPKIKEEQVIVVACENWHHGVIGIVASRITEKYYKPSIILAVEEGEASGSARSVDGFSIFKAINSSKDELLRFGGHDMAAGLGLELGKVDAFRDKINAYAKEHMTEDTLIPKLKVECPVEESHISLEMITDLDGLRPYGMGNPEPLFQVATHVKSFKPIGKEQNHLKMTLGDGKLDAIGFNIGEYCDNLNLDDECQVIGKLNINEWMGRKKPQVMLVDLDTSLEAVMDTYSRDDFVMVYKTLINLKRIYGDKLSMQIIGDHMQSNFNTTMKKQKFINCLDVFKELELIEYELRGHIIEYNVFSGKKVDLASSSLYQKLIEEKH